MNTPEIPPNIQMTPVEFSPTDNADAIGNVAAPPPRKDFQFPIFVPLAIMLLTLIFSTLRDIRALNLRMAAINEEDAPALEMLKKSGKQREFVDSLKEGILKLAPTDPIAAHIQTDFFPAQPYTPPPAPTAPAPAPKTPSK